MTCRYLNHDYKKTVYNKYYPSRDYEKGVFLNVVEFKF